MKATDVHFPCSMVAISGDPIHRGHLYLVREARKRSDLIILAILNNPKKKYLYDSIEERVDMARRAVREQGIDNVIVVGFDGLLVDVYLEHGCDALFRGVRNEADLSYEEELAEINTIILPDLVVEPIETERQMRIISSSTAKELATHGADEVIRFVPPFVKRSLEERIRKYFRIGITGGTATGKSTVGPLLAEAAERRGIPAVHINVDQFIRDLYDEESRGAQKVRDMLEKICGVGVLSPDRKHVDRPKVKERIFGEDAESVERRKAVERLTSPHVRRLHRKALKDFDAKRTADQSKKDLPALIIEEWADMAEMNMGYWVNDNVIAVHSPDRAKFAAIRRIDQETLEAMKSIQWSHEQRCDVLKRRCVESCTGALITYRNVFREDPDERLRDVQKVLLEDVLSLFPDLVAAIDEQDELL